MAYGAAVLHRKPHPLRQRQFAGVVDCVGGYPFEVAKALVDQGAIGELMFIRARYGHGGRLGYDKEWRANPLLSGGGELIDQGVHLIDLARWFLGDFTDVQGHAGTYYWNMPVDDNGFDRPVHWFRRHLGIGHHH